MRRSALALLTVGVLLTVFVGTGAADHLNVFSSDIVDNTIRGRDIGVDAVGKSEIRANAVGSSEIIAGSVNKADLGSESVDRSELVDSVQSEMAWDVVQPGETIRGAIGADYDDRSGADPSDWGIDVSLPQAARNALGDDEVNVNVSLWQDGGGQSAPTTTDTNAGCDGTLDAPTAPAGEVCIYVAGADNAFNLEGYSVRFGSEESRYGFKLKWDAAADGDTFVDAVWAYTAPA